MSTQKQKEIFNKYKDQMIMEGYTILDINILINIANSINPRSACVYTTLLSHAQYEHKSYTSQSLTLISTETVVSKVTAIKCISAMEEKGYLKVIRTKTSDGGNGINHYFFPMESFYDENEYLELLNTSSSE